MDRRKMKLFVERHKKEIIAGVGVVLGTAVCAVVGKYVCIPKGVAIPTVEIPDGFFVGNKIKNLTVPDGFSVGKVMDLFEDKDEIVAIATDLTVNELGKFGEELVKHGLVANGAEGAITAEFFRNL